MNPAVSNWRLGEPGWRGASEHQRVCGLERLHVLHDPFLWARVRRRAWISNLQIDRESVNFFVRE